MCRAFCHVLLTTCTRIFFFDPSNGAKKSVAILSQETSLKRLDATK